jgi:ABC-type Fe3+ transport system substrate-binding protein
MRETAARVIDEYRRGVKSTTDIVLGTEAEISEMSRAGALISEPWQNWMQGLASLRMVAAGGVGVQVQTRLPGITYNSTRLTGASVPKSLADLLKPQYKGRIATTTSTSLFERLASDEVWGADRTLSYVRQLAGQVGGVIGCGDEDRIVKGDFDVLVYDCGSARVNQMKAKGTLIGWSEPSDGALLGYLYMGIPKNAVHPNAARLFINYMLSREAQDITYEAEFADLHVLPGSKMFAEVDRATKSGVKFYELTTEVIESQANSGGKSLSATQTLIRDALTPKK